ncbi:ABC transporter substrate-binding protein [Archangium sp.]|uniref:cytochrome c/ABC transporter substrate-binding protein n=1 Tax=Archangium sp. TaxID=1872627 RepID=UPI002D68C217|nr:ABC transporter substrate-binding protein [Archangium sp.]HYO59958.1 ABC transporter substrate-binding protein [Archangium sp.]
MLLVLGAWGVWALLGSHRAAAVERGGDLTESELRGKALFLRGVGSSGAPLVGRLGPEGVELTGAMVACGRCHGPRGRGMGEGGVVAPNIQASRLFAPVSTADPASGRWERPAYDDPSLAGAILRGRSSSGRVLSPVMPRFELPERELADLLAYLHRLGDDREPGVSEDRLVFGAALPLSGKLAAVGEDVRAVLEAAFEEVNQRGGVFGRRLELRVEDDALEVAGVDGTGRLLDAGVLALVGSVRTGPRESDARLEAEEVPLVAPVGLSDAHAENGGRMIFYVYPGLELQARVAVQHLYSSWERRSREPVLAVLQASDGMGEEWARGARTEAGRREWPLPRVFTYVPGQFDAAEAARWLEGTQAGAVLFSGTAAELSALLARWEGARGRVPVYAPGLLWGVAGSGATADWGQVRFIHPSAPVEGRESGRQELEAFLRRHGLAPRNLAWQMNAYASARLLVEALRRSGADVSRAGLVSALESFQDVDTGVTGPVTFGSQGRVGLRGGFIVRTAGGSRELTPLSDWIALSP